MQSNQSSSSSSWWPSATDRWIYNYFFGPSESAPASTSFQPSSPADINFAPQVQPPATSSSILPFTSSAVPGPYQGAQEISTVYGIPIDHAVAIDQVARQVGIADPRFLANVIAFESQFNPQAKNAASTATGLIQFIEPTAKELGTTTAAIRNMGFREQMELVRRYFTLPRISRFAPFRNQLDVFMAVFYPASIGQPYYDLAASPRYSVSANHGIRTPADYYAVAMRNSKVRFKFPSDFEPTSTAVAVSTHIPQLAASPTINIAANIIVAAGLGYAGYRGWQWYKSRR
jgi:hypothetical protein